MLDYPVMQDYTEAGNNNQQYVKYWWIQNDKTGSVIYPYIKITDAG